jgi:hypothetical protein
MELKKQVACRFIIGALVGALVGVLEIWFYEYSLRRLIAAAACGAAFFTLLGIASSWAARNLLNSCVAILTDGAIAAAIWWLIAKPKVPLSISIALGIGVAFLFLVGEHMSKPKS